MNLNRRAFLGMATAAVSALLIGWPRIKKLLPETTAVSQAAGNGWDLPWGIPWAIGVGTAVWPTVTPTIQAIDTATPTATATVTPTPTPTATPHRQYMPIVQND